MDEANGKAYGSGVSQQIAPTEDGDDVSGKFMEQFRHRADYRLGLYPSHTKSEPIGVSVAG